LNARTLHPGLITALWLLPILALLQASLVGHFAVRGILPSIVLIAVVNWGILRGPDQGMLWALIGGILLDFYSGYPFGTSTVALVIVASLMSLGEGTFIRTHALLPLLTVFAATLLYYLIAMFVLQSAQQPVDWERILRFIALPAGIYNALLNIVGYPLMRRLDARVYPVPRADW
jgi:rod shape-determining protein MreD